MPNSEGLTSIKDPKQRYTKAQCIGRGASKVVYKAFDEVEGIEVAWNEVLCSDACLGSGKERSRMLGEITMLRQLKHKNIMRLYDWWYDKQQQVLVFITELLTDGSLRRYIRRKHVQGVTLSVLKRYAWQILQGLVYLHGHYPPIIHRDLKCDNIFVNGASGELKIGDLGFATLLRGMSAPLSVIGTPEFMAPELYDEHYDEKVDIYSYGMCLLELATLEYPYSECTNPAQIYRKVTRGIPPASLDKVRDHLLKEFILLTINSDPHKRPEARQLLVHPFFEDLRQQIKMKGWLKGPAPALAAAAAAADPVRHAAVAAVSSSSSSPSGAPGAVRVPMSAPDGLAAIAAAVQAADAAAGAKVSNLLPPAAAVAGGSESTLLPQQQRQDFLQQLQIDSQQLAAAVDQMAPDLQGPDRESGGAAAVKQSYESETPGRADTQQQQDQVQQPLHNTASGANHLQLQQSQQQQSPSGRGTPSLRAAARSQSSPVLQTGLASPFAGASWASCSSMEGLSGAQQSSRGSGSSRDANGIGSPVGASRHHIAHSLKGRRHSLDELSEDDVVFDADSQVHTDDVESEHDEAAAGGGVSTSMSDVWQHIDTSSHQQHNIPCGPAAGTDVVQHHYLDTIHEDGDADVTEGDGDDDEGVDCVCRRIDHQQLSFNVGFFNKGMRKRVGFQYNADEDTVDDIAVEMLENLSLMPQQAVAIARKIRAALEALGISQGPQKGSNPSCGIGSIVGTPAAGMPESASVSAADSSGTPVTGKNAAIAIVATAAASAAIESCSTPQQGSIDAPGSYISSGPAAGGSGRSSVSGSYSAPGAVVEGFSGHLQLDAAASPASTVDSGGRAVASGSALAAAAAAAAVGTGPLAVSIPDPCQLINSSSVGGHACTDQLVRELSMLNRDQGQALLQTLQEDLLIQSIAMPEVAAAVGVELGMPLSSAQASPGEGLLEDSGQ